MFGMKTQVNVYCNAPLGYLIKLESVKADMNS